jgi:ubiquitin-conjugating enzyme E2 W
MTKRLQKEFESIQKTNAEMKVSLPTNDLSLWHVEFQGAKGTLYEGEHFTLQLKFNNDYVLIFIILSPSNHPKSSLSSIFPRINTFIQMDSSAFQSCMMVLFETNSEWSPALTVSSICLSVLSMLSSAQKKIKPFNDA